MQQESGHNRVECNTRRVIDDDFLSCKIPAFIVGHTEFALHQPLTLICKECCVYRQQISIHAFDISGQAHMRVMSRDKFTCV